LIICEGKAWKGTAANKKNYDTQNAANVFYTHQMLQ